MKNYKFTLVLFLFLFSFISPSNSADNIDKIAYINIEYIISKSVRGKSILDNLKSIQEKNSNELKNLQKKIETIEADIKKTRNVITEEELKKKFDLLKKNISDYKTLKFSLNDSLKKKRRVEIKNFMKKINPLLETFMKENSLNILLDGKNVIIGKKSSDLSDVILKIVDNNIK